MVKQEVGKRTPLSAITNKKTICDSIIKRHIEDEYDEDRENRLVLIDKNNNSLNNDTSLNTSQDEKDTVTLSNLEDSSSSSCCLNNSSSINITSSTIGSSISNSSNISSKTQKSKKKVQFISNEALDKTDLLTNASKYNNSTSNNKLKLNLNPVNNYANYYLNYRKPTLINHHSNHPHQHLYNNQLGKYTQSKPISSTTTNKPNITYSNTMPSISSVLTNQYMKKTNHSSYAICETDNPFRPEGTLAKEADEFVKELNTKKEREVTELIKNTSLNNSASLSVSELIQQPTDAELARTANEPEVRTPTKTPPPPPPSTRQHKQVDSKPDVVSLPEPRSPKPVEQDAKPESVPLVAEIEPDSTKTSAKKNKKVKSKCGCVIS